jgi:RNA polymerase sigma-70 factor, ECF subfamily
VERQLVTRAQSGDLEAFNRLVYATIDRFFAVAYRILRDQSSAEDATQHAMLQIWRQLPKLRDPDRFEAWAYRLLVNAAYAEHRRGRRQAAVPWSVTHGSPDPFSRIADRDELERGFARLSAEQRTVLVLQHYLNLTHDEMAEILAIPVGTVRSRLHGARSAMRALLEADARPTSNGWTV